MVITLIGVHGAFVRFHVVVARRTEQEVVLTRFNNTVATIVLRLAAIMNKKPAIHKFV